ncbi:MAG: asparagine synthase-related protein [Anaerolineales bacterium]|jgi:asparagine synthase (glutamine-hydrolysing)
MRNQLLRDTDWSSMAHSLEVRVPLVDAWLARDVAKWVVLQRRPNQKALLANAPQSPLPKKVSQRSKTGFTIPVADWLQSFPALDAWRSVPALTRANCHWSRRVAHSTYSAEVK